MDGMQPPAQGQQAPSPGQQPPQEGQGQGPSMEELVNGGAAVLTAIVKKMQQSGAPQEMMQKMVGVMNAFGDVFGGGQEPPPQQGPVSQEGGLQGQPMSPAGV